MACRMKMVVTLWNLSQNLSNAWVHEQQSRNIHINAY